MSLLYDAIRRIRMMPTFNAGKRGRAGFSLLEVLVVVAIGLIITAVGLPRMSNAIANMKLRSSMTTVSGLLQNTRMMAVQQNKTMTAKHYNLTTSPYSLIYYVKKATDASAIAKSDTQVEMEAPITPSPLPSGAGAPTAITVATLGFTPQAIDPSVPTYASFNSEGLPCLYASGACTNYGFIEYFKDNRIGGSGGWAAISISPAGRVHRWFWSGTSWTD